MSKPGIFQQAWYRWKSLRLPWRKQWLVGADLAGNTFWEFKDALNANRLRRIVKWKGVGRNYADVKMSPQWHQWLRHTRQDAPSIQEQQYEISRQAMMKQLAAEADERWKSVPSYLDAPNKQQPQPAMEVQDPGGYTPRTVQEAQESVRNAVGESDEAQTATRTPPKENPWAELRPKGAPSENWQPESWTPSVAQRGG